MKNSASTRSRRVRAICLALGTVLLMGFVAPPLTSQAALSLPHIQTILNTGGVFNILEILPDERTGSLGYYVAGQEPVRGWKDELAKLSGSAARRARAAEIFDGLTASGILSSGTTTPLTLTASYDEKKPWETADAAYEPLTLNTEEQAVVRGTMTPAANGAYNERYEYRLNKSGAESNVQNIIKFEYVASPGGATAYAGTYFYQPTFTKLEDGDDLSGRADMALYEKRDGVYVYAGTPTTLGGVLFGSEYYYASANPEPFASYDAAHPYAAVAYGFRAVAAGETGYFDRTITGYALLGAGGTHNLTLGGTADVTVFYRKVLITGGYRNNNWFLKYVLDMTDADIANAAVRRPDILVRTVRASNVTEALVRGAGLVVLSSGFKPITNTTSPYLTYSADGGANTMSEAAALALYNEVANGLPLLIDYRLMDAAQPSARLKKLIQLCLRDKAARTPIVGINFDAIASVTPPAEFTTDADKSFVKDGIFCFRAPFSTGAVALNDFASPNFASEMSSAVYQAGFSAVFAEIQSENFLRRIDGVQQLPEVVTTANVIRYVINYAGRRVVSAKTALQVLEIQPAKTNTPLAAATVSTWSGIPAANIKVTTMTSAEFAGRIEDINEVYDLVYIGSDPANINANNIQNGIDGRAYNAVGGTVRTNLNMTGLLDRDYFSASPNYNASDVPTAPIDGRYNYNGVTSSANQMRFSGNDIPQSKANDLVNFAKAGYPVILANDLTAPDASNTTGNRIGINTAKVDNSSYLYDALNEMVRKGNVLKQDNAADMRPYLLVSKPAIRMIEMPPVYVENGPTLTSGTLTYQFTIENQTDPTPRETTYDCSLYIDLNADGRYAANERISDIEILHDGNVVDTVGGVYRLAAGMTYTVNRQMPQSAAGIIPWKLSVVKNGAGNEHIHASVQEYTRIRPAAKKVINVLQIVQTNADRLNLASNAIYRQYISELQDFDIRLASVDTSTLAAKGNESVIFSYLDGYDMLIIGFNDTYDGISQNSALAIRQFIDSKKSVLFSHDTTSFYALPNGSYPRWTGETNGTQSDLGTGWTPGGSASGLSQTANSVSFSLAAARAYVSQGIPLPAGEYTFTFSSKTTNAHISIGGTDNGLLSDVSSGVKFTLSGAATVTFTVTADDAAQAEVRDMKLVRRALATVPGAGGWNGKGVSDSGDDWVTLKKNADVYKDITLAAGSYNFEFNATDCTVKVNGTTVNSGIAFTTQGTVRISVTTGTGNNKKEVTGMRFYARNTENIDIQTGWTRVNVSNVTENKNYISFRNNITPVVGSATRTIANLTAGSSYTFKATTDSSVNITLNGVPVNGSYTFTAPSNRTATIIVTASNTNTSSAKIVRVSNMTIGLGGVQASNLRYDIGSGWGYYFNTVIRDAVGLDRYGVTSKDLLSGGEQLRSVVRAGGGSVKASEQRILSAGRGISYAPNSGKTTVADEAQGYTNYTLKRFANVNALSSNSSTDAGLSGSSKVSQVNKGQITTYPFDINLGSFSKTTGKAATMDVMSTHDQYFQLNMHADDVVVWYCLSGGNFDSNPNDVTNAYYIYNKGNVTYTGVGHFTSTVTSTSDAFRNEAKLFINTMIAAYQAGAQTPSIEIRDPDSTGYKLDAMYFVADDYAQNGATFGTSRQLLFKISDPNLATQKAITLKFFYTNAAGVLTEFTPLGERVEYGTSSSLPASSDAFRGNVLYRVTLPDEVLGINGLGNTNLAKLTVTVRVLTRVGDAATMQAEDSLDLIKIGLFDLR